MNKLILVIVLISIFQISAVAQVAKWSSTLPIKSKFSPTDELADRVEFWRKIYSEYSTRQGVFHLVNKPDLILGEIDLTAIFANSVINDSTRAKLANAKIRNERLRISKKWKIANPAKVRLQMGLKDRMQKALFLSGRYLPMMENIFKQHGLPIELTRLVFVESSFNELAQSKVGASGLWQIMPNVARPQGYITAHYDKRNHPRYATELAAKILKANYQKLGSWPLAITAYNHGLTGIRRMKVKARSNQIEDLIESKSKTATWGFASKNFYACFLATLEVERRAHELFGKNLLQATARASKEHKLRRPTAKAKVLPWYNGSQELFRKLNPHLNWQVVLRSRQLPAGMPLQIPTKNYHLAANW